MASIGSYTMYWDACLVVTYCAPGITVYADSPPPVTYRNESDGQEYAQRVLADHKRRARQIRTAAVLAEVRRAQEAQARRLVRERRPMMWRKGRRWGNWGRGRRAR